MKKMVHIQRKILKILNHKLKGTANAAPFHVISFKKINNKILIIKNSQYKSQDKPGLKSYFLRFWINPRINNKITAPIMADII